MTPPTEPTDAECDSCRYPAKLKEFKRAMADRQEQFGSMWLCDLCANSMAGNAHEYPDQHLGQHAILETICYVGNAILDALNAR